MRRSGLSRCRDGIAVINPNGTIDLSSLSGTWRDNAGQTGSWTFLPGAGNLGGSPRPVARASFPAGISAGGSTITNLAPPLNATDAASKGYVDTVSAVDRALARTLFPLPMGAVPSAVGVKYVDTSTSSFTIDVRSYVFPEGGTRQDSSAGSSPSSNGTNGNRLQLLALTAPAPVSASQGYYLLMTAPTYANGDMAFCGAQVTYTAP